MSKRSAPKFTNGSGRSTAVAPPDMPDTDTTVLEAPPRQPDPRETAQEAVHQVMTKDAARTLSDGVDDTKPSTSAARGDDDLMSRPAKRS